MVIEGCVVDERLQGAMRRFEEITGLKVYVVQTGDKTVCMIEPPDMVGVDQAVAIGCILRGPLLHPKQWFSHNVHALLRVMKKDPRWLEWINPAAF